MAVIGCLVKDLVIGPSDLGHCMQSIGSVQLQQHHGDSNLVVIELESD